MTNLSVVIITFNEEKNVDRCINSVINIADDIVVVDSFSTDRTEEICKKNNVRFVQHAFEGHIEQKNWAITQAKYPFILSLDADEALSETLQLEIKKVKENTTCDGYYMNRLTSYCGKWIKHCGWYPDKKLRLWNSRKGRWSGINPHDKYEMDKNAKIGFIKGDILHYSYYSIEQHLDQIQKFSTIYAKAKFEKNKSISVFLIIVRPIVIFLKKYFLKLGFLDGYYGFVISKFTAYNTFLKDIKLRELHKTKKQKA